MQLLKKLWRDESGMTAIEYGLILALFSIAVIALLTSIECDEFGSNCHLISGEQAESSATPSN